MKNDTPRILIVEGPETSPHLQKALGRVYLPSDIIVVQSHPSSRRMDIHAILSHPEMRRDLMVPTIIALQAREGIETSTEQALAAYDKVLSEMKCRKCGSRIPYKFCPGCKHRAKKVGR